MIFILILLLLILLIVFFIFLIVFILILLLLLLILLILLVLTENQVIAALIVGRIQTERILIGLDGLTVHLMGLTDDTDVMEGLRLTKRIGLQA